MHFLFIFLIILTISPNKNAVNSTSVNHYCADMNPQQHINIEQLMGMWYAIEIIPHDLEESYFTRIEPSCPIIHLSEDKSTPTTIKPPLNRDHNHNYGERRIPYNPYDPNPHSNSYSSSSTRQYGTFSLNRRPLNEDLKRLRLWWDENGLATEYHLTLNMTRPGFWKSSGPQNGSELEPKFSHFAGAVQVIKAVGNHLVLTFCHQLPDRDLFTVILARENKLDNGDVHGVHSLLNRRGLSTSAIKKVCYNSGERISVILGSYVMLLIVHFMC